MRSILGAAIPLALLLNSAALAQDRQTILYGGAGINNHDEQDINSTPFAIGALRESSTSRLLLGFDLAGEGTMLDSTYGDNEFRQALSFNLVVGANVAKTERVSFDAGLLLGLRQTVADCPDSFLGYQCYADQAPDVKFEFNYGALASVSVGRTMFGVRATGESVQALVGVRF